MKSELQMEMKMQLMAEEKMVEGGIYLVSWPLLGFLHTRFSPQEGNIFFSLQAYGQATLLLFKHSN